ncbi:MAG: ester cyclase [Pseudonocardia sp.]
MLTDLYRRWLFEVWGAGDFAVADELLAEDLVDHNRAPGQPAGRAGDLWAARAVRTAFPDLRFTLDVAFDSGDLVTGRWTMHGTHTGPLDTLGLPPTGRPVVLTGQEIFRAAGGRFVEVWHQEDLPGLLGCLGLQPPARLLRLAARRSARRHRKELRAGA